MFKNLFGSSRKVLVEAPELMRPEERMRAIKGSSIAELGARLLIAPTALNSST